MKREDAIKQAKKVKQAEEKAYKLETEKQQLFGDMWINTNFEEALDKKRATEEDKKSYIRTNKEYMKIVDNLGKAKAKKNYENNILLIMLKDFEE